MRVQAAVFLALLGLGASPLVTAATHAHAAHTPVSAKANPVTTNGADSNKQAPARRFVADAPLREGMASIRRSVSALDHARHGHLDAAQIRTLAAAIRTDVNTIIAKCRLAPDADAALHPVLGSLLAQSAALERDPGKPGAAIDGLQAALRDYARLFDDGASG
jgi:hypothetical protein